jgi:hypothetical protein
MIKIYDNLVRYIPYAPCLLCYLYIYFFILQVLECVRLGLATQGCYTTLIHSMEDA